MKSTLLGLTIDVSDALDGDVVNSISDTEESLQIANDIKIVYEDIISRKDWQFLRKLKSFVSVGDSDKPTHLKIPDNTSKLEFLQYNKLKEIGGRKQFTEIFYKYPDEFLQHVNQRDDTQSNYQIVNDFDGVDITIRNDVHPTFFTSFDDKYIVLDAFDSDIESTLQGSNTQAALFIEPTWTVDDNFTPELPSEMFAYFRAECISYSQARKDGILVQKVEQTANRQQRHLSQTHGVVQGGVRYPNYGRTPRKAGTTNRSPLFGPLS